MPKGDLERNTFVRGIITEASPLTFPENASIDENNFILNRDGSRQRRKGLNYESGYSLVDTTVTLVDFVDTVVTTYRWENVGNDSAVAFAVVQIGYRLHFFNSFADVLSGDEIGSLPFTSTLSSQYPLQYETFDGKLIVVNQNLPKPRVITYNGGSSFSVESIDIEVRDDWGLDDTLDVDNRPTTLSSSHEYNLNNQGWPTKNYRDTSGNMQKPHVHFFNQTGTYPSNADIWYFGQQPDGSLFKYEAATLESKWFGTTPAPKGHFVIDLFSRSTSRSSKSGVTQPTDTTSGGMTTVAAFAGRIFYSGFVVTDSSNEASTAPNLGTVITFSQIADSNVKFGRCHSINDPTSSELNEPLATDGGVIFIPDASRIFKIVAKDNSLVVIAENGVWEISGADGVFRPDDFSIRKITNIGATNAQSIVNAEGEIYYWSKAGIYVLTREDVSGQSVAKNITEVSIQSFYVDIPSVGRTNAVGRYDSDARKISWLYSDDDGYDGITEKNKYNRELVLDLTLQSFYPSSFGITATDSPYVAGYMPTSGFNTTDYSQSVVHNGDQVQVNGEDVIVTQTVRSRGSSSTKYVTVKPNSSGVVQFTFSLYNNLNFKDWESDDLTGVDAAAFMITGYELFGDTMRMKQVPYLFMHFKRTEENFIVSGTDLEADNPSSCLVQTQWDFADSSAGGKYGTQFQAYRLKRNLTPLVAGPFDYGQSVITTKSKLRGIGRAFSMRLDTEAGKDLHIYGWGIHAEVKRGV